MPPRRESPEKPLPLRGSVAVPGLLPAPESGEQELPARTRRLRFCPAPRSAPCCCGESRHALLRMGPLRGCWILLGLYRTSDSLQSAVGNRITATEQRCQSIARESVAPTWGERPIKLLACTEFLH